MRQRWWVFQAGSVARFEALPQPCYAHEAFDVLAARQAAGRHNLRAWHVRRWWVAGSALTIAKRMEKVCGGQSTSSTARRTLFP
jgi:hypothetical protein